MCRLHLTVRVLEQVTHAAMEDARPARAQSRCMLSARYPLARRFDADELDGVVVEKSREDAHGVRAPAHTGNHGARQAPDLLQHLCPRFPADYRLEIAHEAGEGIRSDHRA